MRLHAKITMQCMQCGKTVYKGDSYYSPGAYQRNYKGDAGDSFSIGAMSGIMAGALLAALPQMGFVSNTKTGNE